MHAHYSLMVERINRDYEAITRRVSRDERNLYCGTADNNQYLLEPGAGSGVISYCAMAYACEESRYYRKEEPLEYMRAACDMLLRAMHPDGTIDFLATNFYTPATFEIQTLCRAYRCFLSACRGTDSEKRTQEKMLLLLNRLGDGCLNGGFHTPNHRWVESGALMMLTNILNRPELMEKAKRYLSEGIDCDENGEFGWITDSAGYLTAVALKDGEPIFIYADEERFPAFMEVMKEYIAAGYFSADVFDDQYAGNQTAAQKAEDLTGFDQNTSNAIDPKEWTAAIPLTSEWNPTPQIARSYNAINCQSFAISASCAPEKVERLMKWADWLYVYDNYLMSHWGPSAAETDYLCGLESGYTAVLDPETGKYTYTVAEVENGTYPSWGDYQNQRVQGIIGGYLGLNVDLFGECTREVNPTSYSNKVDENVLPYLVECYPNIRFFDAAVNERCNELKTEINAYVNEQYVAFISGEKEMSEENLAEYFQTLKDLGYEEYLQIFVDYYDAYLASK